MKINSLKEIAEEMLWFFFMASTITIILGISTIFGSELTLKMIFMPTIFAMCIALFMMASLSFWVFYSYIFYVFDRTEKNNES